LREKRVVRERLREKRMRDINKKNKRQKGAREEERG
jgi:hypothetical protein